MYIRLGQPIESRPSTKNGEKERYRSRRQCGCGLAADLRPPHLDAFRSILPCPLYDWCGSRSVQKCRMTSDGDGKSVYFTLKREEHNNNLNKHSCAKKDYDNSE